MAAKDKNKKDTKIKRRDEILEEDEDAPLKFMRPWHFKPFSLGKRSCMGYKLVENLSVAIMASILNEFDLEPIQEGLKLPVQGGVLCLPLKPLRFKLSLRQQQQQIP